MKNVLEDKPSFTQIGLLLAAFNISDSVSTYLALTFGKNVIEANYHMAEIISQSWYYFFAVKIVASLFFIVIGYLADKILIAFNIPKRIATVCKIFFFGLAVFFAFLTFHNIILSWSHAVSSISTALSQSYTFFLYPFIRL
jgi:hypothetical protein